MRALEEFITPTQEQLFDKLREMFKTQKIHFCKGHYILVQGEAPIMLLAHLDTVHEEPVRDICKTRNGNILMSPQGIGGDDRCGVYALVTVWGQSPVKPWLLFSCNEEIGCVGASQFCTQHAKGKLPKALDELKLLVQIDRKGKDDAVYYSCDNPAFEEYITSKGFKTNFGSCSDISYVAPELGVAAVNLSSGYYNQHTLHEYINRKQLNATVKKVLSIIADAAQPSFPKYEYIEAVSFMQHPYERWGYNIGWGDTPSRKTDLETEDETDLSLVPPDIRGPYTELLDFYTQDELDALRQQQGDWVINELYESEFGEPYEYEDEDDFDGPEADEI